MPAPAPRLARTVIALREAALSTLLGVAVVFLVLLNRPQLFGWRVALYGAVTGLLVFLSCQTLYRLVGEPISRKHDLPRPLVASVVFFFGGVVGWFLGALVSQAIGLTRWHYSRRDIASVLPSRAAWGSPSASLSISSA